ncbi:MAG: restriction endonuclease [Gammaproteobacteria bacterium]|nr:restriction endonuclease [Gammaproteobacteria bacterium]
MNIIDAAEKILREATEPLNSQEITDRMIEEGLRGKTPPASVRSAISVDIKTNGVNSRFVKTEPGRFGCRNKHGECETSTREPSKQNHSAKQATQTRKKGDEGLTFIECAFKVLENSKQKKPMKFHEITKIAMEKKWLLTDGKTPSATMSARIYTEIRRNKNRGERPRFVLYSSGFVGLSQWSKQGLESQIDRHNKQTQEKLLNALLEINADDFEVLVLTLLTKMGFDSVTKTPASHDRGIDVRGTLLAPGNVKILMAVQAKRWKLASNVRAPAVRELRGSIKPLDERGLIITTSDFSPGARKEAEPSPGKPPIALMNGVELVKHLTEYEIGIKRQNPDLLEIDEATLKSALENPSVS